MKKKLLFIARLPRGGYALSTDNEMGGKYKVNLYGYSKREAIRRFRELFDCKKKHFTIVDTTTRFDR